MRLRQAFTIIEMIFVLAMLGVVLAVVLPSIKGLNDETKISKAAADLAILQRALESYWLEKESYPQDNYQKRLINDTEFKIINTNYYDPFATDNTEYAYYYLADYDRYLLVSAGPDRRLDLNEANIKLENDAPVLEIDKTVVDDVLATNLKVRNK